MSDTYLVIFFFFIASVFQQAHDRNARLRQHQAGPGPGPAPAPAPAPATVPAPVTASATAPATVPDPAPPNSLTQNRAATINVYNIFNN